MRTASSPTPKPNPASSLRGAQPARGPKTQPRINAAGRLYRADAGVELFLTDDPVRAAEIGKELSRANSERRATERAWARRAKQIDAVTFNVSGMYGDLQGLVPSLPRIELLELPERDVDAA